MPVESMHPDVHRILSGHLSVDGTYGTWRANGTTDHLLIHTISGEGLIATGAGPLTVTRGDCILYSPGVRHDYRTSPSSDHWEFGFSHFHARNDWRPLLLWPLTGGVGLLRATGEVHTRVMGALGRAVRARYAALARADLFAMNALEEALLWLDSQNPLSVRTDARVLAVAEHVAGHLAGELDIGTLARVVRLSPSHLSHLFVEHLGITPQRFVERERIMAAQQLLDLTDRPISAIARELGWRDAMYFSQRFKKFSDLSPREYRNAGRAGLRRADHGVTLD
jgi:AraC family transcriptional regulator of arabinose operon